MTGDGIVAVINFSSTRDVGRGESPCYVHRWITVAVSTARRIGELRQRGYIIGLQFSSWHVEVQPP